MASRSAAQTDNPPAQHPTATPATQTYDNYNCPSARIQEPFSYIDDSDLYDDEDGNVTPGLSSLAINPNGRKKVFFENSSVILKSWTQNGLISHLVSADALCMASDAWKRGLSPDGMLPPKTWNINGREHKILELDEEDEEALEIVLNVIHLRSSKVPEMVSFETLRNIAIMCNKYFCADAVMPWASSWMTPHAAKATEPGREDWLFICRRLRQSRLGVVELSKALVLQVSSKSACGSYFLRFADNSSSIKGREVSLEHLPDDIVDFILAERSRIVSRISGLLRDFISDIQDPGKKGSVAAARICSDIECLDGALGSLIRVIKHLDLYMLTRELTPGIWHGSINNLLRKIDSINMTTLIPKRHDQTESRVLGPAFGNFSGWDLSATVNSTSATSAAGANRRQGLPVVEEPLDVESTDSLRFYHPAFERSHYQEQYMPCETAFRLGRLIKGSHEIAATARGYTGLQIQTGLLNAEKVK